MEGSFKNKHVPFEREIEQSNSESKKYTISITMLCYIECTVIINAWLQLADINFSGSL